MEDSARAAVDLRERIRAEARRLGFDLAGITDVGPSEHAAFYRAWLAAGRHGEMSYLARPDAVERRLRPDTGFAGVRSAIVVAQNYYVADDDEPDASRGIIARYARGRDYHKVMKRKLLRLLRWLEGEVGHELPLARAYVDTGPVLERELARRAGLGWFGRNTMLIDPRRGSYFFLGTLLTELELESDAPFETDHCGTCSACVSACPTGALLGRDATGAPVIDATRCISYLTIEQRGPIPRELRPLIGNRVFGCDICQSVCPFNNDRFVRITCERDYRSYWREARDRPEVPMDLPGTEAPSLVALMRMTREEWDVWTRGSGIRRAGYAGFKRNVAVAMGNWLAQVDEPSEEAMEVLRDALEDEEPLVREHAGWALERASRY
ncbi:MAG TPA: tRNA epoxyqueuosine(34) reductase QueG [Longimicrobiales bacterium]